MREIIYGIRTDYTDEYICIGKDATLESEKNFVEKVIKISGDKYLKAPN
jgi:hypothetical protein